MKVSCAQVPPTLLGKLGAPGKITLMLLDFIDACVSKSEEYGSALILLPAGIGHLRTHILELSKKYTSIIICPGIYDEWEDGTCYNTSSLIQGGRVLLCQRQLYVSHDDKKRGIARGTTIGIFRESELNIALIINSDISYAQVGRQAALKGAELVLSPQMILDTTSCTNAVWREVQSNQFFGIASCLNGDCSIIEPLVSGGSEDGYRAKSFPGEPLIHADLNADTLRQAQKEFNVRGNFNPALYTRIFKRDSVWPAE